MSRKSRMARATSFALGLCLAVTSAGSVVPAGQAQAAGQESILSQEAEKEGRGESETTAAFDGLLAEMKADMPEGLTEVSYSNNYQSMEPESFTYKSGAGEAVVNNGLTMQVNSLENNSFLAVWDKTPYLRSGVVTATFRYTSSSSRVGFVIKSNDNFDGIAIKYDVPASDGNSATWVLQEINGAYQTFSGPVLEENRDYELKIGFHGNQILVALDGEMIFNGEAAFMTSEMTEMRGQIGLHKWYSADAAFQIKDFKAEGVGTMEKPSNVVEYKQDYEGDYTPNWSSSAVVVETTDTGNKVLKIPSGSGRIVDLDSPSIKEGTLSLRYKAVAPAGQTPQRFGFRFGVTAEKFRELNWDGGKWVVENEGSYPSIDMASPISGVWNDLLINFAEGTMTVYLNKEEVGTFELDVLKNGAAGQFGIRTWGSTAVLVDDLVYTNEIRKPQEIVKYENDFEDSITGNWDNASPEIVKEGTNRILRLSDQNGMARLSDSPDLAAGTYAVKVKAEDAGIGFGMGDALIRYEDGWKLELGGAAYDFAGEASSLKLKAWNDVMIKVLEDSVTLNINGQEASVEIPADAHITAGKFGISGQGMIYLDDLRYTEQFLEFSASVTDKLYYEEYFDTITELNWSGLTDASQEDGRLVGAVKGNGAAFNESTAVPEHGVFQVKMQADQEHSGIQIGNLKIYSAEQGWILEREDGTETVLGQSDETGMDQDYILRAEIVKGVLTLKINNQTAGSADVAGDFDKTKGGFGIYNPNQEDMRVSVDAMGMEELRVYTEDYGSDASLNWTSSRDVSDQNQAVHNAEAGNMTVHVPGVTRFLDEKSPEVKNLHASFDFTPSVDDSMAGGRYGFVFRDKDYAGGLSVEVDINGSWRVNVNDSYKTFDRTFSMAAGETYRVFIDLVGNTVKLKFEKNGTVTDMGSVTMDNIPDTAGHFGVKSWYGQKSLTFDNLEIAEEPQLPLIQSDVETEVISRGDLRVNIDKNFPGIFSYELNGKTMKAQEDPVRTVVLNGEKVSPMVSGEKIDDSTYAYTMTFADQEVVIKARLTAMDDNVVRFEVTEIQENGDYLVRTLSLGENNWACTDDKMEHASYAWTRSSGEWHGVSEELQDDMSQMEKGGTEGTTMAMISGNGLAASIENNVMSGGNKVILEKTKKSLVKKAGIRNGEWTYRHSMSDTPEEKPWAKIVLTEDVNEDNQTDWQDGAVAHRRYILEEAYGAEDIADNMMYIAFNFASQANDTFLNTLETGKVLYNYTDGFGQMILHKGYQAEGHDDDIPSYSNIGVRQGGVDDFKYLISEGEKYNMNIGVHLNATEYHLDANELYYNNLNGATAAGYLSDRLSGGWDWIDASYYVDQTKDVITGQLKERFESLYNLTKNEETGAALDFYYIDVYTGNDYNAYKLVEFANDLGVKVGTEFSGPIEPGVIFTHWGTDLGYPNKGNKSQLSRMVKNNLDIFVGNALYKGQKIAVVDTWGDSKTDVQQGVTVFYNEVLPTKYMQHFGVLKSETDKITFEGGVTSERNTDTGMIELKKDGNLISSWRDTGTTTDEGERHAGEANSLIPWTWDVKTGDPTGVNDGAKLYHWNTTGEATTWNLTDEFSDVAEFDLYENTQQGKVKVATIPNENGTLTIDQAKKNTPYVLYPKTSTGLVEKAENWGEGSPAKDFAFNAEKFADEGGIWSRTGDASVEIVPGKEEYSIEKEMRENIWNRYAQFKTQGGELTQTMTDLVPGQDYTVGVWAQTSNGRKAGIEVTIDGKTYTNYVTGKDGIHRSSFKYVDTTWQRMDVEFHVPEGVTTASLKLTAEAGEGTVNFDDVKVWKHLTTEEDVNNSDYVLFEDFENTYEGWGPFEYGGGSRKNHIASDKSNANDSNDIVKPGEEKQGPVMTWVIGGENSLKLAETEAGRYVVTNEASLKLKPNTAYDLSFDYTLERGAEYVVYVKPVSDTQGSQKLAFTNHENATEVSLNNTANTGDGKTKETFQGSFVTGDAEDYQIYLYEKSILVSSLPTSGYALIVDNFGVSESKEDLKEKLQTLYDANKDRVQEDYTADSWSVFKAALDKAWDVLDSQEEAEYRAALDELNAAVEQLAERYVDLEKAIEDAEKLKAEDYTAASFAKMQAVLQEVKNAAPSDMEEASGLAAKLNNAVAALVNQVAARAAVEEAEKIQQTGYTKESWDLFRNAVAEVKNLIQNKEDLTQQELNAAVERLQNRQKGLEKAAQKEEIEKIQSIHDRYYGKDGDYTPASFAQFKPLLTELETLLADQENLSEQAVKDLLERITQAEKTLVKRADKNKLSQSYAAAKAMDFSSYTDASVKAVKDLFVRIDRLLANQDASQSETDALWKQLEAAIKGLVKKQENTNPETVSLKLNVTRKTLGRGEKFRLKATARPAGTKLTFKSSNKKVAVVGPRGKVKARKVGKAVITVKASNGKQVKCTITVKKAPKKLTLKAKKRTLKVKRTLKLKARLSEKSAGRITWKSSNKKIATVSANGTVKALRKGKVTITARTYNNKKAKITLTIKK